MFEFDIAPDSFLTENECGHVVFDIYACGPFFGREIQERIEWIEQYHPDETESSMVFDVDFEFGVLLDIRTHLEARVGYEWASYMYCELDDEDWFIEGFANEGLEAPSKVGEIDICGIEYSIFR